MERKLYLKNLLNMLIIVVSGFILFNLAFLLAALVINITNNILGAAMSEPISIIGRILYLLLMLVLSSFIFRSRLKDLIKAAYMTMPLMVLFVAIGISLYQLPKWIVFGISAVLIFTLLLYFRRRKLSWLYYFSACYVAVLALAIMLFNIEI